MKFSSLQMIAIVCILAIGVMPAAPLVQIADAGKEHWVPAYTYEVKVCEDCGNAISWKLIAVGQAKIHHGPNDWHNNMFVVVTFKIPNGRCSSCDS